MSFKVVQNYQLSESSHYVEDGIQVYIAQHNTTKLPYLLKKVNTKQVSDKAKYQSLINEVGLLKILSHPSIVECHKMLRTSNNIYLVYDYCDGSPLSQIIKECTKQQKINITCQLIESLKVMGAASIVHCNLKPSSIIVSNDGKVKIMNFIYGHNRQGKKSMPVKFKPQSSDYVAPEILNQGTVHERSDYYSLGIILEQMNLTQEKSGMLGINGGLGSIIDLLVSPDASKRPNLQIVEAALNGKNKVQRKSSQHGDINIKQSRESSLKKAKSLMQTKQSNKNGHFPLNESDDKKLERKFVEQILKKRNLAIFLLSLSQVCLCFQQDKKQSKLGLFLSYMFMKKSCKIICALNSYLKQDGGQNFPQLNSILNKSQKTIFEKKPDFFRIASTIQKQAGNQKRWLQEIYKNVNQQLPLKMKQIINQQEVKDKILLKYVTQFLYEILQSCSQNDIIQGKIAEKLYLMSQIIPHKSYQKMFDEIISQEKINLEEQVLYDHVRNMDRKKIISQLQTRVQFN